MPRTTKPNFWTTTKVAIFSVIMTSATALGVAFIGGVFSKKSDTKPMIKEVITASPHLDSGTQINSNIDIKQDNKKGKVNNEFVTGNKTVNNSIKKESKGTVSGTNNHVVNGTNNGINGDVLVNTDIVLTEQDKNNLLYQISNAKVTFGITSDSISMVQIMGGNVKVFNQIRQFLTDKGFYLTPSTSVSTEPGKDKGVLIWHENNMVRISVGVL